MKIFLSVGHSILKDGTCTSANGVVNEYQYCKRLGQALKGYLEQSGHNVTYVVCPEKTFTSAKQESSYKLSIANGSNFDLVVELHLNASNGQGNGSEVLCWSENEYAARVQQKLSTVFKNRGVKVRKDLYMLRDTKATAILIESFFCDNAEDCNKGSDYNKIARLISEGISGIAPTPNPQPTPKPAETQPQIEFVYSVKAGGKVWSEITNLSDWAGKGNGTPITDIAIRTNIGSVKYRVHVKGGNWLGWITDYNWSDPIKGYAGNGKPIDAVQVYYNTPSDYANRWGYKKAKYRVSPLNSYDYFGWQYDTETGNGMDGYAGAIGVAIDKFQLTVL